MEIKYRTQFGELLEHLGLEGEAAEIGVAEGRNAQVLISSPAITKLYMIDNWGHLEQVGDGGHPQSWHDNNYKEAQERVETWREKSVILKGKSMLMIAKIPEKSLVFVYIDCDHSHAGFTIDLVLAHSKVIKGGVIAGHDVLNPSYGVGRALADWVRLHPEYNMGDVHYTEEDGDNSMVSFWFIKK